MPSGEVDATYRRLRSRTFWGVTVAYTLYYVCRMTLGVVKQPLIDGGVLTAGQLGIIGSAFYFVYAVGKFLNGFIADYCNIRRFMAVGIGISAAVNLILGLMGLGVKQGTEVTVCCDGANEDEAAAGLKAFLEENL